MALKPLKSSKGKYRPNNNHGSNQVLKAQRAVQVQLAPSPAESYQNAIDIVECPRLQEIEKVRVAEGQARESQREQAMERLRPEKGPLPVAEEKEAGRKCVKKEGKESERGYKDGKRAWVEAEEQRRCREQQRIQIVLQEKEGAEEGSDKQKKKAKFNGAPAAGPAESTFRNPNIDHTPTPSPPPMSPIQPSSFHPHQVFCPCSTPSPYGFPFGLLHPARPLVGAYPGSTPPLRGIPCPFATRSVYDTPVLETICEAREAPFEGRIRQRRPCKLEDNKARLSPRPNSTNSGKLDERVEEDDDRTVVADAEKDLNGETVPEPTRPVTEATMADRNKKKRRKRRKINSAPAPPGPSMESASPSVNTGHTTTVPSPPLPMLPILQPLSHRALIEPLLPIVPHLLMVLRMTRLIFQIIRQVVMIRNLPMVPFTAYLCVPSILR